MGVPVLTDSELPKLLVQHRPSAPRKGYPTWLRARVTDYVSRRQGQGITLGALADELGVTRQTLVAWVRRRTDAVDGGFSALVVTPDPVVLPDVPLMVVSPHGFSLRGISIEQALHALTVLR
jgi:hypothetical protein